MTTLEIILISYILLNWFLGTMIMILPVRILRKMSFIFVIICPPLIIAVIGELIKRKMKEKKEERENE
jgi:uncharacterized membrane protein